MNARLRALAVLIAVFLLGGSVGVVSHYFMRSRSAANNANPPGARDRRGPRLEDMLQLSPNQLAQFKELMMEFRPHFEEARAEQEKKSDAIRAEMNPKFEAIRAEMNRRILTILNDDQKKKFEAFLKQTNDRRGRHRSERPGSANDRR